MAKVYIVVCDEDSCYGERPDPTEAIKAVFRQGDAAEEYIKENCCKYCSRSRHPCLPGGHWDWYIVELDDPND